MFRQDHWLAEITERVLFAAELSVFTRAQSAHSPQVTDFFGAHAHPPRPLLSSDQELNQTTKISTQQGGESWNTVLGQMLTAKMMTQLTIQSGNVWPERPTLGALFWESDAPRLNCVSS